MSLVRVNRYGPRGGGRKVLKVKKKKTSVKQEWDVSLDGIINLSDCSGGIDVMTWPWSLETVL